MQRRRSMGGVFVLAMAMVVMFGSPLAAVTVTGYMQFNGALELWAWTQSGKTAIGTDVTASTMPSEMADPAKVRVYESDGTLAAEYRNYRPEPNGYQTITNWRLGLSSTTGLVAWNLSGLGAPSATLQSWGQQVTVTGVVEPTAAPDYDNVGTNWYAQTNGGQPTWWCEAQADALTTDVLDAKRFVDYVALTFDDAALNLDGTASLWVGSFVTADLAGLEAGTAPYAVLEGRIKPTVLYDNDGDGYLSGSSQECDDDPSDDPAICASCTCETDPACAGCARCIHAGATEVTGDAYDTNCNGQPDCFVATASFGTEMEGKVDVLREFRDSHLLASDWGRVLVDLYYTYSPPVASYIDSRPGLKTAVRTVLLPVVGASWAVSHKGTVVGLALGMVALGLVFRRRENMGKVMLVVAAAGLLAVPLAAEADVQGEMAAVIQQSGSCIQAVESLLGAGYPAAEVIPAVLAGCRDGVTDVIASAIRSGADPFTVAYAAKGAGVDLQQVVSALEGVSGESASSEQGTSGFQPPAPPISISSAPAVVISGTGSSWGQSHYVASPSL